MAEKDKKEVVNWKDRMAESAKEVAKIERPEVGYISLRGGNMTYMNEPVPGNQMDVIVLAATYERTWYDHPFDPDDISPPQCYAKSRNEPTLAPAANVANPIAETCHECPYSKWESAASGRGQACKMRRKLAITNLGDLDELAMLATPPTSNTVWSGYANKLSSAGLPPWGVVTNIKCVPFKTYYKLEFTQAGTLKDEVLADIYPRVQKAEALLLEELDMSQGEEGKPADSGKF